MLSNSNKSSDDSFLDGKVLLITEEQGLSAVLSWNVFCNRESQK